MPIQEWIKQPKNAAIAGAVALVLLVGLWFVFRPTAKPEDQAAWNVAAMEDPIPGYQLYMREMPSGYYSGKAESRVAELKTEVDEAFARAKAANTPAAYTNFLNTYAKQGVDLDEARNAYANADAQENNVRAAYNSAWQMRSRDGYQGFLTQYGTSTYAPDVRTRLAACRTQTQTTGGTQASEMTRSATASANTAIMACNDARHRRDPASKYLPCQPGPRHQSPHREPECPRCIYRRRQSDGLDPGRRVVRPEKQPEHQSRQRLSMRGRGGGRRIISLLQPPGRCRP